MQCSMLTSATGRLARPAQALRMRRRGVCCSQSGRSEPFSEPFNEGAVQVKRLVNRDRKELLGNKIDILDKYTTEFGDPDDSPAAAAAPVAAAPAAPASSSTGDAAASKPATVQTRFTAGGAATPASPFTSSSASSPFASSGGSAASPFGAGAPGARIRSLTEPMGLSPDMGPDPVVKQAITPGNILTRITLTQVVLFLSFSSMIGLMLATFSVVLNSGAVRLAGID